LVERLFRLGGSSSARGQGDTGKVSSSTTTLAELLERWLDHTYYASLVRER